MLTTALVVKLTARPGFEDELATFLTDAAALAQAEAGTPVWFALRSDVSTFWIVDAFACDADRLAHLNGPIAAALLDQADRLLSTPPEIAVSDVLAGKIAAPAAA
jgi:quinol monooxygenase YgiN